MELLVFDLDGTLLNSKSAVSDYTGRTLELLRERGIAYTVATGRTLHGARSVLEGHVFDLPHIYKNGALIWQPQSSEFSHSQVLSQEEIRHVIEALMAEGVTPFIFTLDHADRQAIYHPPLQNEAEEKLVEAFSRQPNQSLHPVSELPGDTEISNIGAMGPEQSINRVIATIENDEHLVAFSGQAIERKDMMWIDIHHSQASKGGAIEMLKEALGVSKVICFGDSQNDLSMFEMADEAYAPENAKDPVKAAATAIIGHNDEDGIAQFLRKRYQLPES